MEGSIQAAIAQVRDEAWPDVRDADELHDVLHTLVALPEIGLNFGTGKVASFISSACMARRTRRLGDR